MRNINLLPTSEPETRDRKGKKSERKEMKGPSKWDAPLYETTCANRNHPPQRSNHPSSVPLQRLIQFQTKKRGLVVFRTLAKTSKQPLPHSKPPPSAHFRHPESPTLHFVDNNLLGYSTGFTCQHL